MDPTHNSLIQILGRLLSLAAEGGAMRGPVFAFEFRGGIMEQFVATRTFRKQITRKVLSRSDNDSNEQGRV
jgi:hypothetical protein